jgi:hypothetical protein
VEQAVQRVGAAPTEAVRDSARADGSRPGDFAMPHLRSFRDSVQAHLLGWTPTDVAVALSCEERAEAQVISDDARDWLTRCHNALAGQHAP